MAVDRKGLVLQIMVNVDFYVCCAVTRLVNQRNKLHGFLIFSNFMTLF